MASWDVELQELLCSGVLTGYALIGRDGAVTCAYGSLAAELCEGDGAPSPAAQQLHAAFYADACPASFELCGQRAVVVHREPASVCAVSHGKRLGLAANYLPAAGVLVTAFGRPHLPQAVVPKVGVLCFQLPHPACTCAEPAGKQALLPVAEALWALAQPRPFPKLHSLNAVCCGSLTAGVLSLFPRSAG